MNRNKETIAEFPYELNYGSGLSIRTETPIGQAAVLKIALANFVDNTSVGNMEPLTYPEACGLYDIASTIYYALADNFYHEEVDKFSNFT